MASFVQVQVNQLRCTEVRVISISTQYAFNVDMLATYLRKRVASESSHLYSVSRGIEVTALSPQRLRIVYGTDVVMGERITKTFLLETIIELEAAAAELRCQDQIRAMLLSFSG